jgi:hypothetical protein
LAASKQDRSQKTLEGIVQAAEQLIDKLLPLSHISRKSFWSKKNCLTELENTVSRLIEALNIIESCESI